MKSIFPRALIIIFLTAAFGILALQLVNYDKIALGVKVANLHLGGQSSKIAEQKLADCFRSLEKQPISLEYNGEKYLAKLSELGITLNLDISLRAAFAVGRRKNMIAGFNEQLAAVFQRYKLKVDYSLNEDTLNNLIATNLNNVEKPPRNANLIFNKEKNNFEIISSQNGWLINREKLKNDFKKIGYYSSIILEINQVEPQISNDEIIKIKEAAFAILNASPYILKYGDEKWLIEKETVADWLVVSNGLVLNRDKAGAYLTKIAESIDKETKNAKLVIGDDGRAQVFSLAEKGLKLDIEKNIGIIEKAVIIGREKEITLITTEIQPTITNNDDIDNLGIIHLLSQGESNFSGSPKNRIHNIKIGAAKMNGIILKPGEEFSFNKFLGEVGAAEGYLPELVIKKNKTVPEYGGGLCQISTTVFRTAVNTGLKITERAAHPFVVKYYNPPGFDATIYPPHPDLKFINDTPNNILIQGKIEGNKLLFEIYGTPDGREVKIKGPTIYESNPDGSMKTILYQEIWRDGKMERQSIFRSNYKSPALYPVERNPLE